MSAAFQQNSPTKAKNIAIRRVLLSDASQMPSDLSSTPGGTLFSTTPGGTRIVYDRTFLLECRNSPLAKSPPVGLPAIPGVTCTVSPNQQGKNGVNPAKHGHGLPHGHGHAHGHGHVPLHGQMTVPESSTAPPVSDVAAQPKKPAEAHPDEPMFEMDM